MFTTRPEQQQDFDVIRALLKRAFHNAPFSDGDEDEYVDRLREGDRYLPDLALVAEKDGRIVGHVMLIRLPVATPEGIREELLLSPLCVDSGYRGCGCGGRLIEDAIALARNKGFGAVFLAGDPAYYRRYGFERISAYNISATSSIPERYLLVREIQPGELALLEGGSASIH